MIWSSIGVLVLCAFTSANDDVTFSHKGIAVSVDDNDGEFTLYQNGSDYQHIRCKLTRFQELDASLSSSGGLKSTTNFDTFVWDNFAPDSIQGNAGSSVRGSAWLELENIPFMFNTSIFVFDRVATLAYGNLLVTVPDSGIKFTYDITDVPWSSPSVAYLQLSVELDFRGGNKADTTPSSSDYKEQNRRRLGEGIVRSPISMTGLSSNNISIHTISTGQYEVVVIIGNGQKVEFPAVAILDGVESAINITADVHGNAVSVDLLFPRFVSHAEYDPTLSLSSSAPHTAMSSLCTFAIILLASILAT